MYIRRKPQVLRRSLLPLYVRFVGYDALKERCFILSVLGLNTYMFVTGRNAVLEWEHVGIVATKRLFGKVGKDTMKLFGPAEVVTFIVASVGTGLPQTAPMNT